LKPDKQEKKAREFAPIAIVGMGCMLPKAKDLNSYWVNIKEGVSAITDIPPTHWKLEDYYDSDPKKPDHTYSTKGGFLDPVDFTPIDFGIVPNNIEATDSSQLLGLMVAKKALEDAGYGKDGRKFNKDRTSVIIGVTGAQELVIPLGARLAHPVWKKALREEGMPKEKVDRIVDKISDSFVGWQENSFPGLLGNVIAGRIANYFDLGGTNCAVDAACASSLTSLHMAAMELASGNSDMVLTGGVDTFNDIFMYMCFSKTHVLSPTGEARPFDEKSDGTILGEGLGILVLKRLEDAKQDKDNIYAVIKGIGSSSDGKGKVIYAPCSAGQTKALKRAYEVANISPDTVELIEAHGTGTKVGDTVELEALTDVYSEGSKGNSRWCALGTVKSQIGHTKAAAGVSGIIKAVLALHNKVLPPTNNVTAPLAPLKSEKSPFYVNTKKKPWLSNKKHPRRAAVSAFGFGGSNFHCVLEEYHKEKKEIEWDRNVEILSFSADRYSTLKRRLKEWSLDMPANEFHHRAAESRKAFSLKDPYRLTIAVDLSRNNLGKIINSALRMIDTHPEEPFWETGDGAYFSSGKKLGKLGIIFPGQGSQYVGMLRDIACAFPKVQKVLLEANSMFAKHSKGNTKLLTDYIYPKDVSDEAKMKEAEKALRDTKIAQPAIGAVSIGFYNTLADFGVSPESISGHSYGELTALCAADCYDQRVFHTISAIRGKLMAECTTIPGAMLAVRGALKAIEELIKKEALNLVIANKNSPTQAVLSGAEPEINRAATIFSDNNFSNKKLMVSSAFHSKLVSAVRKPFEDTLKTVKFATGRIAVFANSTALEYPRNVAEIRSLLASQLVRPVEFVDQIDNMYKSGVQTFVEVGPGNRLSGLVRGILGNRPHKAFSSDASSGRSSSIYDMATTIAHIAALGHEVKLKEWNKGIDTSLPKNGKPTMTVKISGANYRSPSNRIKEAEKKAIEINNNQPKRDTGSDRRNFLKEDRIDKSAVTQDAERGVDNGAIRASVSVQKNIPLTGLLEATQRNMTALQRMQEETAKLHHQFLKNQEISQNNMLELIRQQNGLISGTPQNVSYDYEEAIVTTPPPSFIPTAESVPQPIVSASEVVNEDIAKVLLEVISEKTGYPAEMLELDMGLDSDLGIDSIKQVEILSSLQDKLPNSPVVKPEDMGKINTLRDLESFLSAGTESTAPQLSAQPTISAPIETRGANENIDKVLLEVISEKTGYPAEMLELDMGLDSDLGIDSIKQVEILSSLQDKLPNSPIVRPEDMGRINTLRDLKEFLAPQVNMAEVCPLIPKKKRLKSFDSLSRSLLRAIKLDESDRGERISVEDGSKFLITDTFPTLAEDIKERLTSLGYEAEVISLDNQESLQIPASLGGLIILSPDKNIKDNFILNSFRLLRLCSPSLRKANEQTKTVFATVSVMDGLFGLGEGSKYNPMSGGLSGLSKTAGHEFPEVNCKAIDISPTAKDAASKIADEIFYDGAVEVGISEEGLYTLKTIEEGLGEDTASLDISKGDAILVTGGARGVTAEVAVAVAERFKATMILIGRSIPPVTEESWLSVLQDEVAIKRGIISHAAQKLYPKEIEQKYRAILSNREVSENISRINSVGGQAVYYSADVRNRDSISKVLQDIKAKYGKIRGLIHGAGVLADKKIENKKDEEFEMVFSTKVFSLLNILEAIDGSELKTMVLFSSITGRVGRRGQIDYAAANEVLNKVAQQQSKLLPNCRVVSVNWGPWDGGMVNDALKKIFTKEGIGVIPLKEGAEYLVEEISSAKRDVEILVLGKAGDSKGENESDLKEVPRSNSALKRHLSLSLDSQSYPILESHIINGNQVAPMAMIVEWMSHAALHANPGLKFIGLRNLRILKGMIIKGNNSLKADIFGGNIKREGGNYIVPTEIRGEGGKGLPKIYSSGEIIMSEALPQPAKVVTVGKLLPYTHSPEDFYKTILFHGSQLQGIKEVIGYSDKGIAAKVNSAPSPSEWMERPYRRSWTADPLILDSAFQLMILWTHEKYGAVSLPAFISNYTQYRESFPKDGVTISALVREDKEHIAVADIDFIDQAGVLISRISGYECTIDKSLNQSFRNNKAI